MTEPVTLWLLGAASFAAALISSGLSIGGGYVLFGATTLLYPLPSAIALQPALSYASLLGRAVVFRDAIAWKIVRPFTAGSLAGVAGGLALYHVLPEQALAFAVGAFMLVLAWTQLPLQRVHSTGGMVGVGVAHAFSGTVLGMGSVLQPVLLHSGIARQALVGTFAASLLVLEAIRAAGYAVTGFSYASFLPAIIVATGAGVAGTAAGKLLIGHIPERGFRLTLRLLVTGLALRLVWSSVAGGD